MNKIVIAIIVVVIVGAGSFFAGTKIKNTSSASNFPQMGGQMRNTQEGTTQGRGALGGGTVGEIIAKDDTSITVKLADGGSKIVLISSSTNINKTTVGTKDDLKIGEQVVVMGQANGDGSVKAQSVQLGSAGQMFGRRPQEQTPSN